MSISTLIKNAICILINHQNNRRQSAYIKKIMLKNHIPDKKIEGEDDFKKKWALLSKDCNPIYFRCFNGYIQEGGEVNIISGNICSSIIEPVLNPIRFRDYYGDKNVFGKLLPKEMLPKTILRRMSGVYMDEDYHSLNGLNESTVLEYVGQYDKFILKPTVDSSSGNKVSLFERQGDNFVNQNNVVFSFEFIENNYDDFIIQECVEQSEYMSQFNPTSINTIRTVVYRSVRDNKLYVTNAILRIGANKAVVDNAHSGGKFCGIDKHGNLGKYVCETYGERSETFNGLNFEKSHFRIPEFNRIIDFSKNVAKEIPHHRLVALDIAVDKNNNPVLIEYNINGFSYWLFQFSGQVALDGFTDEIIEYCKEHINMPMSRFLI